MSKTICPLPWVHQATYTDGSILPCCVAGNRFDQNLNSMSFKESWNSLAMKNLRLDLLNGKKPSVCSRCWEEEAAGYKSHRLMEIEAWNRLLGESQMKLLFDSTDRDGSIEVDPISYDLRLGNACNLQCIMCRPQDSVKWFGLAQKIQNHTKDWALQGDMAVKLNVDRSKFSWSESPEFWEDLKENLPNVRELIFGGGEPLIWSKHPQLIEECVRTGAAKNIQLRYHTNLTALDKNLFDLWRHFRRVEVFASIDGVGDKNHYMRYPAQWSAIEKNLTTLEEDSPPSVLTMILTSVHVLSIFHLDEFSSWIENRKFKKVTHGFNGYFHPGLVIEPKFLNVQIYPLEIKEKIKEKILTFESQSKKPSHKIQGVISYMFEKDMSHILPVFRNYVEALDHTRGTDFQKTFPDLYEALFDTKRN